MQSGLLLEHAFKFAKTTLGLTAARVRTPEQADRWVRLVMAAFAQLLRARPHAAGLRRPWETRPPAGRPLPPGRVRRGFANIRRHLGTPAHVAKPARPGPGRPKGSVTGPAPRYPIPKKQAKNDEEDKQPAGQGLKPKLITRTASWLRLSRRQETWRIAEILILRHQLAVLQRR